MSGNKSSASKIKLGSFDDLFEGKNAAPSIIPDGTTKMSPRTMIIPIDKLRPFKNHPFKVIHDAEMDDLIESIKMNGVIEPIVTRKVGDFFEIIAGHRRTYASQKAGKTGIPGEVLDIDDDTATIYMVDSNKYREKILPSEKAFSCKMKLEAIKHQGKKTSTQSVENSSAQSVPKKSVDLIGEEHGESRETIRRYIRLTYLIPELLDMVDSNKLNFVMAVDISYLSEEMQRWLYEDVLTIRSVKPAQIASLRKYLENHAMSRRDFVQYFEFKTKPVSVPKQISTSRFSKYIPPHSEKENIEEVIADMFDRNTPRRPEYWGDGYDENGELIYDNAKCPNCGNDDFEEGINNWGCKFCPECGQALDWSKEGE